VESLSTAIQMETIEWYFHLVLFVSQCFVNLQITSGTLFSLNFASTRFRDFRDFEKIAKFNTREI